MGYSRALINKLGTVKVYCHSEENGKDIYDFNLTEQPTELSRLLEGPTKEVDEVGINPASWRHMGYIPGVGLYPSPFGDYISTVNNRYARILFAAPSTVRPENMLLPWICGVI